MVGPCCSPSQQYRERIYLYSSFTCWNWPTTNTCTIFMPFRVRKNAVLCALHPEVIRITPEEENSVSLKLLYVTFKSFFQSHHSGSCYGQSLKFMLLVILCITEGISVCNGFYHSPWIIAIRLPGHPHLFHFLPIHPLVFFSD